MQNHPMRAMLVTLLLFAACACSTPSPQEKKSEEGSSKQDADRPGAQARDPIQSKCRVPCSVSPGPGCC